MILDQLHTAAQPGDIIFIRISNFLYRRVAAVTGSWTSHVGMIYSKTDSECLVAESAVPLSKLCPLDKFISRSENNQFGLKRLNKNLLPDQVEALKLSADERLGKLYHLGFKYDSPRLYCSKFIYDIYKEVLDLEIGKIETMQDLLNSNPNTPQLFWKLWYRGKIPWRQRIITPASQYDSPYLDTVLENLQT